MRRLFIALIVITLMWSGWWLLGAFAMERGVTAWLDGRRAEGWSAQVREVEVSGFPFAFTGRAEGIALADPVAAAQVSADNLQTRIPSYWPFSAQISFPETPMTLETPQGRYFLNLQQGQADLVLEPSIPLDLGSLLVKSADWQLNAPAGNILSAEDQITTIQKDPKRADVYHITSDVTALTPGDVPRLAIGLPTDWPRPLSQFSVAFSVGLSPELQQPETGETRALLRELELTKVDLSWGTLSLSAVGQISIDVAGVPEGSLNLTVKNWRDAYEIAKQSGAVQPEVHLQYDLLLNGLSNIGGDPATLDLTVSFRDGQMYLGPIALGPAPLILF